MTPVHEDTIDAIEYMCATLEEHMFVPSNRWEQDDGYKCVECGKRVRLHDGFGSMKATPEDDRHKPDCVLVARLAMLRAFIRVERDSESATLAVSAPTTNIGVEPESLRRAWLEGYNTCHYGDGGADANPYGVSGTVAISTSPPVATTVCSQCVVHHTMNGDCRRHPVPATTSTTPATKRIEDDDHAPLTDAERAASTPYVHIVKPNEKCRACAVRTKAGFDGQCPMCASARTRAELAAERASLSSAKRVDETCGGCLVGMPQGTGLHTYREGCALSKSRTS